MTIRAYQDSPDRRTVLGVEAFRESLLRLARIIHAEDSVDSALQSCAEIIYGSLQTDYVEILEHIPELYRFEARVSYPVPGHVQPDPTAGQAVPQDLGSQAGYTLLRNQPVMVTDTGNEDRFDTWEPLETVGLKSGLTVPVTSESSRLGVLGIYCFKPRSYTAEEVTFLTEVSRYLANVIVRRRDIHIRRAAERRLSMVEEATSRAASALDEQLALKSLARLFSSSENGLAEVCLIDMDGPDDRLQRAAAAIDGVLLDDSDTVRTPLLYPQEPDCPHGPPAVLSSGQPDVITEVTDEHLSILARDEAHLDRLRDLAPVSYICVPIKVRRHTLGGLVLMSRTRLYTDREARHAARLGSIVALAVDGLRARLATLGQGRGYVDPYLGNGDRVIRPRPLPPTDELSPSTDADDHAGAPPLTQISLPATAARVLSMFIQDFTAADIAKDLGTTRSAVYKHEARLKVRFGVESRKDLVDHGRRLGYGTDT